MEPAKNLTEMSKCISEKLLESIYLIETLSEIVESEAKYDTIISIIRMNISSAFKGIEQCRKIIGICN